MDGNLHADSLAYFYAILYTILDIYTNGNLYPDPELYAGHAVEYTHTIPHSIPQPII